MIRRRMRARDSEPRRRRSRSRFLAVGVGLLAMVLVEGGLRLGGWGRPAVGDDPYVEFTETRRLFVPDASGARFEIPVARRSFFRPASFAAVKPSNGFRVFCLGGSTVQGRPFANETSFTAWLELSLRCAEPAREFEVVNCGGVSYASYRLVPIVRELLEHAPDLFVLYTGHNEFLEDRTYRAVKQTPTWVVAWHRRLTALHGYNLLRRLFQDPVDRPTSRARLGAEVDALLDYRGGLADYHRDEERRAMIVEHFELNLERMVRLAAASDVPILLVNPVANLNGCPPFKIEHRRDLGADDRERFDRSWRVARDPGRTLTERTAASRRALDIDAQHAGAHFVLARCLEASADFRAAKAAYIRAKDEDVCPLRMLESMHAAVHRVAASTSATLVDVRALFERLSPNGLPGKDWLVDHVHPSIHGHQRIASCLFEVIERMGFIRRGDGFVARKEKRFREHLRALPPNYYIAGRQRLVGLQRWTEGRALVDKPANRTRSRPRRVPASRPRSGGVDDRHP